MLIRGRPLTYVARAVLVAVVLCAVGAVTDQLASTPARAASVGQLREKIGAGQGHISALSGAVRAASGRIGQLDASIATLARRLGRIQADLNAKRAELARLRSELAAARLRLARLEAYEAHAERVLAQQLVASYESDNPDVVTVVLSATGFRDLLERLEFMERVRKQDVDIIGQVRAARRAVTAEATRLESSRSVSRPSPPRCSPSATASRAPATASNASEPPWRESATPSPASWPTRGMR